MRPDWASRTLRYLVIGCGSIGSRHARNLRDLGVGDIVVYDPDRQRAGAVARECGVGLCESLEEAYRLGPDAVLVCAPTSMHLALAREALQHNCHAFVEKPLSVSLEGVREFLEEAASQKRVLLVGYNLRFDPLLQQLATWLKEDRIGRVVSARLHFGSYLPERHPWEDYRVGYGAQRSLGGGVILDAIHELDYALWLFGDPSEVYCVAGRFSDLEIDVEDVAEIVLTYPEQVVSVHLDYIQRPPSRWCEILGTEGQIRGDLVRRRLRLYGGDRRAADVYEPVVGADDVYVEELKHFLECIDGGGPPAMSGWAAARSLIAAEAAKEAGRRGGPVRPDFGWLRRNDG